eukprot:6026095-Pyramimonas_sp.AAC.1
MRRDGGAYHFASHAPPGPCARGHVHRRASHPARCCAGRAARSAPLLSSSSPSLSLLVAPGFVAALFGPS